VRRARPAEPDRERGAAEQAFVFLSTGIRTLRESVDGDAPENSPADMRLIAEAVEYLASQQPRAYTHELMLIPAADRWVP
jgi:hypothetical protein